jgi:hypothetical protein
MRAALPSLFLALVLLSACGSRTVTPTGTTTPRIATGSGARRVVVLTDLEEVRDVAVAASETYVATDDGVLVYPNDGGEGVPQRLGTAEGLPSHDVHALALERDGTVLVATAGGLASIRAGQASTVAGAPRAARAMDLAITTPDGASEGTAWLCTLSGLYRRDAGTWSRFGEPIQCTTLAATPEGQLWVGTTAGILYVDGDVVREHPISGGIPAGYVRSIVPVLPGQILALLSGPSRAELGFWNGESWFGYTLPGLEEPVVGLVMRDGAEAALITRDRAFAIVPSGNGTAFRALHASPGSVRSFRAATTPASADGAPADLDEARVLRPLAPLAAVPETGPTVQAPGLVASPLAIELPTGMYRAIQSGDHAFAAVGNAGVIELPRRGAIRALRSRSLVPEEDLQIATEVQGGVWVRSRDGDIAKWIDGRLRRLQLPDGIAPQAIASGPRGAYLAALVPGTRDVRIFVSESGSFRPLTQRTLDVPITGVPFVGVAPGGNVWIAVRIEREEGGSERVRGAAVIPPEGDGVVYHHRAAAQGQGLPLPDEVAAITFDGDGNAWFASLGGAVRVEEFQAIVFDESRGVRGEVVTDVASGSGMMWIAAAEGLGSYANRQFDFTQPALVRDHRPTALATDAEGHLWAAGRTGLLHHDGTDWRLLGTAEGLPTNELRDVEIDGAGRVWLLTPESVVVLIPEGAD